MKALLRVSPRLSLCGYLKGGVCRTRVHLGHCTGPTPGDDVGSVVPACLRRTDDELIWLQIVTEITDLGPEPLH